MDWVNDSDWNSEARFATPDGSIPLPAHTRGYADGVSIESVPGPHNSELLVLFRAEAGHTGAAIRLKDLLQATKEYHPELWEEVAKMGHEKPIELPDTPKDNPAGYSYHGSYTYG